VVGTIDGIVDANSPDSHVVRSLPMIAVFRIDPRLQSIAPVLWATRK
jgi:hypothetical protein